jgi:hypothetical protein
MQTPRYIGFARSSITFWEFVNFYDARRIRGICLKMGFFILYEQTPRRRGVSFAWTDCKLLKTEVSWKKKGEMDFSPQNWLY